jgi:hypothetical protein
LAAWSGGNVVMVILHREWKKERLGIEMGKNLEGEVGV